jgi:tetratricopeptide (TPR) repeat protein
MNNNSRMSEDETAARKMVEANPSSAIAWYNLGYLLAQDAGRANEAEAAYRKANEIEPDNPRYVYRLGLLLHENLRRYEEAEAAYRRAVELDPENVYYYSGLVGLLVQRSRRSEALVFSVRMRESLRADQNWYGLAALDAILGDAEAAIAYLRLASAETNFNRQWARNDPDLASIRNDPRFEQIVAGLKD